MNYYSLAWLQLDARRTPLAELRTTRRLALATVVAAAVTVLIYTAAFFA